MTKYLPEILAAVLLGLAAFLFIHQYFVSHERWLNYGQIWNHETLIICFVFGAVCLLAGKFLSRLK